MTRTLLSWEAVLAAALAAARMGKKVVLTEVTDWIGGQLTSQAVPPDEHKWIEQFGCTSSYRRFRDGVRLYFRMHYPLRGETLVAPTFQLGGALVHDQATFWGTDRCS